MPRSLIFDRENQVAAEYEAWLRETLESKLQASEPELSSFVNFAMANGPAIGRKPSSDDDFLRGFRSDSGLGLFGPYCGATGVLSMSPMSPESGISLALPEGEILAHRCGLLAIDLLYGHPEKYPATRTPTRSHCTEAYQLLLHGGWTGYLWSLHNVEMSLSSPDPLSPSLHRDDPMRDLEAQQCWTGLSKSADRLRQND